MKIEIEINNEEIKKYLKNKGTYRNIDFDNNEKSVSYERYNEIIKKWQKDTEYVKAVVHNIIKEINE